MKENLIVLFWRHDPCEELEKGLIQELSPPLNIDNKDNVINKEFTEELSQLRDYHG